MSNTENTTPKTNVSPVTQHVEKHIADKQFSFHGPVQVISVGGSEKGRAIAGEMLSVEHVASVIAPLAAHAAIGFGLGSLGGPVSGVVGAAVGAMYGAMKPNNKSGTTR
jgi:hypothetical protein